MTGSESRERLLLMAIGLLVLLGPALILIATLSVLILLGDLALGNLTLLDFVELYVVEVVLLGAFSYGLYRLTGWLIESKMTAETQAPDGDDGPGGDARDD